MEITAREHGTVLGKHQRVIGDGIGLAQQNSGRVPQLIKAGADHLGLAAQAIRVLHAVIAIQVRQAYRAARQQAAVVLGYIDLAGLATQRMDARIKRAVAAACCVDGQRAYDQRGFEHGLKAEQSVQGQRGRSLRAVNQRQAFFGAQRQRRNTGCLQHGQSRSRLAVDQHKAFAHESQCHVREWR